MGAVSRPVIAILGGGVYAPRLCELLAAALSMGGELRLAARRADRLAVIAARAAARVAAVAPGCTVTAAPSVEAAVEGADAVVLLVRVGGLAARAHDERFPGAVGIQGDEGLGPGGIANAWRTLPALAPMARAIRAGAPHATVWNLVAPLGLTTRLLLDAGLDAVGVCELPLLTLERLAAAAGADLDGVTFAYAGLNHLGWFWDVRSQGDDVLARAAATADGRTLVDAPTLAGFGAAPLRYYYEVFARDAGARLGVVRTPGRALALEALAARTVARFAAGVDGDQDAARPTPWFDRALVPMLAARLGGAAYTGFANVRNAAEAGRWVPTLPGELVVEVAAVVDAEGVHPRRAPAAPASVSRFLAAMGAAEALAYEAAIGQDPARLRAALAALPLPLGPGDLDALVAGALRPPTEFDAEPSEERA